jgi:hypothetical protein
VSKLIRDVALFNTSQNARSAWIRRRQTPLRWAQDAGRHHPGLNEHLRIFDRHLVSEFISHA